MKQIVAGLLLGLSCLGAGAQSLGDFDLTVSANLMTRGEFRKGGLPTTSEDGVVSDHAAFIVERTLLGVGLSSPTLSAQVTTQHSGVWGGTENTAFNVYEAWAQLSSQKGFFAKVGRQNLSYDDERIFGADDWSMTARSHDALKLGWEGKGHKVHLIGGYNQNAANTNGGTYYSGGLQPYKSMNAVWYHYAVPSFPLEASLLFLNVGMQDGDKGEENETTRFQQMAGSFVRFTPRDWDVQAAYYRQFGRSVGDVPIDAWMGSFKAQFSGLSQWVFYSGYDYLSGDPLFNTPNPYQTGISHREVVRGFSSLYGSRHKFYGAMDFFYVSTYIGGFTPGLQNAYAGAKWKPGKGWSADAAYHFLATATAMETFKRPLGHEVELSLSWAPRAEVTLSAGYSYMRGTETMEVLKRTSENRQLQWGWVMMVIKPDWRTGR